MRLHDLRSPAGATSTKKRVGRGIGSGMGKTSTRGQKGQRSRSGSSGGTRPGFEGGQMPLQRRVPKRGFTNIFGTEYAIVNVRDLNVFEDGSVVGVEEMRAAGLVKKMNDGIKILGDGQLEKKLTVQAHKFSGSAEEKIAAKGGRAEVI